MFLKAPGETETATKLAILQGEDVTADAGFEVYVLYDKGYAQGRTLSSGQKAEGLRLDIWREVRPSFLSAYVPSPCPGRTGLSRVTLRVSGMKDGFKFQVPDFREKAEI
jgi:hypothetical protein